MDTNPAEPRVEADGAGAFGWLTHDSDSTDRATESRPDPEPVMTHAVEHRLDPLAVNTMINRGLIIALCLIVVAVMLETVRSLSSSHLPSEQTTKVLPSAHVQPTHRAAKVSPKLVVVTPTTTATKVPVPATTPTTTVPVTFAPATTPMTTLQRVVPITTPRATIPPQTVVVPVTTPPVTAPPDTVVVPYTPTS